MNFLTKNDLKEFEIQNGILQFMTVGISNDGNITLLGRITYEDDKTVDFPIENDQVNFIGNIIKNITNVLGIKGENGAFSIENVRGIACRIVIVMENDKPKLYAIGGHIINKFILIDGLFNEKYMKEIKSEKKEKEVL